jgi:hypothetical protein
VIKQWNSMKIPEEDLELSFPSERAAQEWIEAQERNQESNLKAPRWTYRPERKGPGAEASPGGFEPWTPVPNKTAPPSAGKRPAAPASPVSRPAPSPQSTPSGEQPTYKGNPPRAPESDPLYKRLIPPTSQADPNPRLVMADGPKPTTAPKGVAMRILIGQATLKRAEAPKQLIADIRAGD